MPFNVVAPVTSRVLLSVVAPVSVLAPVTVSVPPVFIFVLIVVAALTNAKTKEKKALIKLLTVFYLLKIFFIFC